MGHKGIDRPALRGMKMTHRGHTGVYEFDEDELLYSGHVVTDDLIYFEGSTIEELRASMVRAVDQHIAVSERDTTGPS